jgi:hypothetical protein
MTTYTTPYCAIHGYDFSSIVYTEGVDPSGGELGVEETQVPNRNYADVSSKGRAAKKYKIKARSTDRDEIETFLKEVNTAPEDAEFYPFSTFYPFDATRFGLIASAFASLKPPKITGAGKVFYEADAEIVCREAWLYGPDQGMAYAEDVALNAVSSLLTNEGHERAPISYLQASGDYVSSEYVQGLSVRITPNSSTAEHDREMTLCDKLLRDDIFEVGWRQKEVRHSWETAFSKLWAETAIDVHGKTSGGSITDHVLTLDNSDYLMIPFHGPLPISGGRGSACLELQVSAISGGSATAQVALLTDLEDMVEVDHDDLVVGLNTIYVPDLEGVGHVAIGIKAAASGAVSLSNFRGSVKRYVAPAQIPFADPDEDFKIRVEKTAGTQLAFLEVDYNDRYWY